MNVYESKCVCCLCRESQFFCGHCWVCVSRTVTKQSCLQKVSVRHMCMLSHTHADTRTYARALTHTHKYIPRLLIYFLLQFWHLGIGLYPVSVIVRKTSFPCSVSFPSTSYWLNYTVICPLVMSTCVSRRSPNLNTCSLMASPRMPRIWSAKY